MHETCPKLQLRMQGPNGSLKINFHLLVPNPNFTREAGLGSCEASKVWPRKTSSEKKQLLLINLFPSISINKLLGNLNPEPWATQVGIDDLTQIKTNIRYYDMIL